MIRCVVFDFDGTLVVSNQIKRQTVLDIAKMHNEEALMVDILNAHPGDRHSIFDLFVERSAKGIAAGSGSSLSAAMVTEYTDLCEQAITGCPEVPGASDLLARLESLEVLKALNSATPTKALYPILRRRGWLGKFELMLGGPSTKAENLGAIAAEFRLEQREILMVGDKRVDQIGAAEFGCHFVALVRPDSDFAEPLPSVLYSLSDLPALLAEM